MNLLSSFRPLLATATGTAVLVLLFAIDLQSQPSTSRQVTVTPSAADYAAAAAARNVRVHLRPANTPVGRKTSVAAISNSPAGTVKQSTAPQTREGRVFLLTLSSMAGTLWFRCSTLRST